MNKKSQAKPPIQNVPLWMGVLFIGTGLLPIVFHAEPSPGIPQWILYLACSVFILAGFSLIGMNFNLSIVSNIAGPLIILIFAIMATWIGFAPGERHCTGTSSFLFFSKTSSSSCRLFGFSGILLWMIFLGIIGNALYRWVKRK